MKYPFCIIVLFVSSLAGNAAFADPVAEKAVFQRQKGAVANTPDWIPLKSIPYVAPGTAADCSAWAEPFSSEPAGRVSQTVPAKKTGERNLRETGMGFDGG